MLKRRRRTNTGATNAKAASSKPNTPRQKKKLVAAQIKVQPKPPDSPIEESRRHEEERNLAMKKMEDTYLTVTKTFRELDKNKDGHVDRQELQTMIQNLNVGNSIDAATLLERFDKNSDGQVDLVEFSRGFKDMLAPKFKCDKRQHVLKSIDLKAQTPTVQKYAKLLREKNQTSSLRKWFLMFDEDNTGSISNSELRIMLTSLSGENVKVQEVQEIMDVFDTDTQKGISYSEFTELVCDKEKDMKSFLDLLYDEDTAAPVIEVTRPEGNLSQVMRNVGDGERTQSEISDEDWEFMQVCSAIQFVGTTLPPLCV